MRDYNWGWGVCKGMRTKIQIQWPETSKQHDIAILCLSNLIKIGAYVFYVLDILNSFFLVIHF